MIISWRTFCRCVVPAVALILTLALSCAAAGKDTGVIIMRLEDGASSAPSASSGTGSRNTGAESAKPAEPTGQAQSPAPEGPCATEECPVIVVPPAKPRLAPPPAAKSASCALMDAETGQLLYGINERARRPNASTTKIMTAILMIERCKMDEWITASKSVCQTPFTSLHLKPGEKILAKDLLVGMMVRSANDAAAAAAERIAGSQARFAKLMNEKAKEIGCRDTNFVTPNGLYDPKHYSSAYDLCLMARYGFRYSVFNEAVSTKKYFLNSRTKNKEDLAVFSHNKFMKSYQGADGVKSGYVKQAGKCLVGSATRNGWRLVSAVLKSENVQSDTTVLMDYGFGNFRPYTVAKAEVKCAGAPVKGGASDKVPVAPARDLRVIIPRTEVTITTKLDMKPVEAPVAKGTRVGTMIAEVGGVRMASVDLRTTDDVGVSIARRLLWWGGMCGLVLACLVVGVKYGTAFTKNTRRRRRRVTTALRDFNRYR